MLLVDALYCLNQSTIELCIYESGNNMLFVNPSNQVDTRIHQTPEAVYQSTEPM